jgi:hypothetical protein
MAFENTPGERDTGEDTGAPDLEAEAAWWGSRDRVARERMASAAKMLARDKQEIRGIDDLERFASPLLKDNGIQGFRAGREYESKRLGGEVKRLQHEIDEARRGYHRSERMSAYRYDVIRRYLELHNGNVSVGEGYYYCTAQLPFTVECSNAGQASFVMPAVAANSSNNYTGFDFAVGDTVNWIGGNHTLTLADTNLTNPGANIYPDELLIVEWVKFGFKGVRIVYPNGVYSTFPTNTAAALAGNLWMFDGEGQFLPQEIFDKYNYDECRLARLVGEASTLHFQWQDVGLGGTKNTNDIPVLSLQDVPDLGRRPTNVRFTSGAAGEGVLQLPRGYIWCLNRAYQANNDEGGNGLFNIALEVTDGAVLPFVPLLPSVSGPGQTPTLAQVPTMAAVYWQITVGGTSILPGKRRDGSDRKHWERGADDDDRKPKMDRRSWAHMERRAA